MPTRQGGTGQSPKWSGYFAKVVGQPARSTTEPMGRRRVLAQAPAQRTPPMNEDGHPNADGGIFWVRWVGPDPAAPYCTPYCQMQLMIFGRADQRGFKSRMGPGKYCIFGCIFGCTVRALRPHRPHHTDRTKQTAPHRPPQTTTEQQNAPHIWICWGGLR